MTKSIQGAIGKCDGGVKGGRATGGEFQDFIGLLSIDGERHTVQCLCFAVRRHTGAGEGDVGYQEGLNLMEVTVKSITFKSNHTTTRSSHHSSREGESST